MPRAPLAVSLGVLMALFSAACAATRVEEVDGERALARVAYQVEAGPRIPGSPGHARVREWIAAELRRLGAEVTVQREPDPGLGAGIELHNVIGRFRPARPRAGARGPLVLCAHYDTRPWADQDPDTTRRDEPIAGANDGGSGVAVLLEVAERLSQRAPPCPVDLVFFDAEDQGTATRPEEYSRGAHAYAKRLPHPPPRAAILFDMVGDRDLAIHPEMTSVERASNLVDQVLAGARATGAVHFHPEPRYRLTDDHVPLLEAGVPAVDVIDFDYPAWHTHQDQLDQVSAASLAEVARVAIWLVYHSPVARLP